MKGIISEHQPVWKKAECSLKSYNASDNEIHRITTSSRQMKTQIAKISYANTLRTPTKKNKPKEFPKEREDDSTEPESRKIIESIQLESKKKKTNDNTGFDFVKMKEERDREFKNLNSYLTEIINKKSPDQSKITENNKVGNETEISTSKQDKMFRRCKTEIDVIPSTQSERRSKARVGSIVRSKSNHPPDTKSHELLSLVSQKSYDVERARKFLLDQKRKRRSKQGFTAIKAKDEKNILDKEQIKKRLEELRRNSRAIVTKNVNKKKNVPKAQSNQNIAQYEKTQKVDPDLGKEIYFTENNCGDILKVITADSRKTKNDVTPATGFSNINEKVSQIEETGESKSNNNNMTMAQEHMEETAKLELPEKRIGLLRKPETKDHSFTAIAEFNLDKENIALEMMTPKLGQSVPMVLKTTSNDINNGKGGDDISMEFTYRKPATVTLLSSQTNQIKNSKLLKGNEVDSNEKNWDKVHSKLEANTNNNAVNDLPYWLKPSSVQIYPYNFIMAVRRKLEALADVRSTSQTDIKWKQNVNNDDTFLPTYDTFKHLEKSKATIKIGVNRKDYTNCNNSNIQSLSEINSNISSISVQHSNNPSKTLPKKSNSTLLSHFKTKASAQASDDDTTISSSILNSPEGHVRNANAIGKGIIKELQGNISPLSLERVENLTIMSRKKLRRAIAAKHVNINRGDSEVFCTVERDLSDNKNTANEIDFNKLLNDFNRSLSQVIEVNDRLKTTINKSQEICGTTQTEKSNPSDTDQYTTDFEKCSSHRPSNCSSDVQNEIELRNAHIETSYEKENYELKYVDKQTFNHSKYCIKSKEQNITSHQKLEDQLRKTDKSKDESISSQKYWLNKACNEASEICSCSEKEKILKQEKCAKNVTESLISTHTSGENGYEIAFNITENIRRKTENKYKKNKDTLKTCLSERKTSLTHMKHEDKPYKQQLLAKSKTSSHKILEMVDHSNMEISLGSASKDSLSDLTCSYSNIGMYEKLIRNETTKSEHLAALLKIREKALFDRTKGQIAWLEVQKERCKSNGLLLQIAAIKKKQRGILLKMEKEREELKRLLQSTTTTTSSTESTSNRERKTIVSTSRKSDKSVAPLKTNSTICQRITPLSRDDKKPPTSQSSSVSSIHYKVKVDRPEPVIRANYSLETSRSLEELLVKRELDLQRRREHVERLMQWHLRLDQEEAEVLQMENKLLNYNTHKSQYKQLVIGKTKELPRDHASIVSLQNYNANVKVHRRLKEIKNSLKELKSISRSDTTAESNEGSEKEIVSDAIDCVRTTGAKLNKLWRRLTSQQFEKYEPNKHYQLSKTDLEHLYEAAKVAVLEDFSRNEGCLAADLLEKSILSYDMNISPALPQQQKQPEEVLVPPLKLSASPESSDKEGESWEDTSANSLPTDNYSPSTAAEKFQHIYEGSSRSATVSCVTQSSSEANILLTKITSSMRSSAPDKISNAGLVRSLSDSILYSKNTVPQNKKHEAMNEIESLSKQVLENNIPLAVPLIAYSETHESTKSTTDNVYETAGLNCKNVHMEKETKEIQSNILSSSQQNLDPIPNVIHYNKSSCNNLDTIQNYNNSSSSYTNLDSIKSPSLQDEVPINSKTFISQPKFFEIKESTNGNLISESYENDFESTCEFSQIDELLLPHFKSIVDTSLSGKKSDDTFREDVNIDRGVKYNIEDSSVSSNFSDNPQDSQALHYNSEILKVPSSSTVPEINVHLQVQDANNGSSTSSSVPLMPDIINELEIRRCQQILIEPEKVKQFENSSTVIPYMYVREIPNKPPPPYVPPAHGSPMTTIFPSEERIREISYRRTHELYCELLKTDYITETGEKLPTVMDEKITNIYERIILDICREYLDAHREVLKQGNPVNFHTQLAFFNPPNRLHCIQKSVYKEVRRCLAMDKPLKRRTPIYSVYGQRANHDHIGKIIIQEMYDEDDKWCNFHREENEVIDLIICEMVEKCLNNIAKEVLFEENGAVDFAYRNNEDSCGKDVSLCSNEAESKQPNNSVDLRHDA